MSVHGVRKDQRKAREARKLTVAIVTPELADLAREASEALKRLEDRSAELLRERVLG